METPLSDDIPKGILTETIGILITLFIVDLIIRKRQDEIDKPLQRQFTLSLTGILDRITTLVVLHLSIHDHIEHESFMISNEDITQEVIKKALKKMDDDISSSKKDSFNNIYLLLERIGNELSELITLFDKIIENDLRAELLNMKQRTKKLLSYLDMMKEDINKADRGKIRLGPEPFIFLCVNDLFNLYQKAEELKSTL
ncbi:MAG: hypothetical protein F9K45_04810 [Melioribacteraceae bacterium]|nr:MAG: hypothetical protein F9K45_04810 [Melioribacteraceae bacterium]